MTDDDGFRERFGRWESEIVRTVAVPPLATVRQRARRQARRRQATALAAVAVLCAGVAGAGLLTGRAATTPPRPAPAVSPTAPASSAPSTPAPSAPVEGTDDFGPNAVSFFSADSGWSLNPGTCNRCGVLATTADAGGHWTTVARSLRLPGSANALVEGRIGMYVLDDRHGYLYTDAPCSTCLIATSDGGHTWQPASLPAVSQLVSSDETTAGAGRATLYALSLRGSPDRRALYRHDPGAGDWTRLRLPTTSPATLVVARGDTVAVLARGDFERVGRLWVSVDRGLSWIERRVPCGPADGGAALVSLALGNPSAMLLDCFDNLQSQQAQSTQHHVYGSADGGRHWRRLGDPPPTGDPVLLADNGSGHAFLAVESGAGDLLATTEDGGLHWQRGISGTGGLFFGWAGLRFVNPATGFIFGPTHYAPERLYRTLDGGRTWHALPVPRPH